MFGIFHNQVLLTVFLTKVILKAYQTINYLFDLNRIIPQ